MIPSTVQFITGMKLHELRRQREQFRDSYQQLRQAVFLASPYAVIASAPIEGFLHRTNTLDSLGDDEPETPCKLNR